MKRTRLELDTDLYAAWLEDESLFLTSAAGRYRSKVRGPGGAEVVLGFEDDDLQHVLELSFFAGATHLACRPEEVEVLEVVNGDGLRVWQDHGWQNPFRFRANPMVDLARREALQVPLKAGLGLLLLKSLRGGEARAGTTTTPLSGIASNFMPIPQLWYKNAVLTGLNDGASVATWENAGSWGSPFNLVTGGNGSAPTKRTDSGFACAFFNGSQGLIFPSGNSVNLFPSSNYKNWTIFVVYRDSNGGGNFGYLSRYQADSTNGSIGMYNNGNSNMFCQIHNNDGFPYTINMASDDAINLTVMRWGTPSEVNGTITYWRGRTGSPSSTSWSAYGADLIVRGVGTTRSSWNTGYLYEMLVYDSALSDSQIAEVRKYLAEKFPNSPVAT